MVWLVIATMFIVFVVAALVVFCMLPVHFMVAVIIVIDWLRERVAAS